MEAEEFDKLTKQLRKSKREDKKKYLMEMVDQNLDERDIWMGLKTQGKEYQPRPFSRKRKNGEAVPIEEIAEEAAKYLANEQWGKTKDDEKWKEISDTWIVK